MKISIVTISYNQAQFLEEALLSVIGQGYTDLEFIVVDPGSTDKSREIIESYRKDFSHIIFEADDGPADGLNKGFSLATGDILGFLNADDVLLPGALATIAALFQQKPGLDVLSGRATIIDANNKILRTAYSDRFSVLMYAYGACVLVQPSTFFRSAAYKRTSGFNPANRSAWDGELFVDMKMAGAKFGVVPHILSGFRLHETSITASGRLDDEMRKQHEIIFQKVMNRQANRWDYAAGNALRLVKHAINPLATFERLTKGPIHRRHLGDG